MATLFLTTLSGSMAQNAPALIHKTELIVNKSSSSTTNASRSNTSTSTSPSGNTTSTSTNTGNTTGTSRVPSTTNSNRQHRDRSGGQNQVWGHPDEDNDHQDGRSDQDRNHKTCYKSGNQEYDRSRTSRSIGSRGHGAKCVR